MKSSSTHPSLLFVNHTGSGDGPSAVLCRTASYLAGRGYRVGIATPENQWMRDQKGMEGIVVKEFTGRRTSARRSSDGMLPEVMQIIREGVWDIVHVHGLSNRAGAMAARLCGRPLVWHLHELTGRDFPVLRHLPGMLATAIVCPSTAAMSGFPGKKSLVIPDTVPSDWARSAKNLRPLCGNLPNMKVLLWIGAVAPGKGLDVFINSLKLAGARPDITAVIIAAPVEKHRALYGRLRQEAEALKVKTIIQENVSDPKDWYAACDIVVHSSVEPEAFGLTALEAMAFGKPLICTGGGGMEDFVRHGVNANVIKAGNPEELWEAACNLADRPEYCRALAAQALTTASEYYSDKILPRLEELYLKIMGS